MADDKPSRGWQIALGCGAGCLVLLVAAGIACGLAWQHMRARAPVSRDVSVLTGGESLYARLFVSAEDPGMKALRARLMEAVQRMQDEASKGGQRTFMVGNPGDTDLLPLRLEWRTYPPLPGETSRPWVAEVDLSGGFNMVAAGLRVMGRKERQAVGAGAIYHFADQKKHRTDTWVGMSGNRVLFAQRREPLVPLLDGTHPARPAAPPAEVQGLVDAVRLEKEDAAVWTLGGADVDASWLRSGAASLDLVDDERIAFRLALEVPMAEDKEALQRIIAAWVRDKVPEGLDVKLGDPEWIGPGTVRYTGEITGLSAALDDWFDAHLATRTTTPRAPARR